MFVDLWKRALLALPLLAAVGQAAPARIGLKSRSSGFDYENDRVRGVNLGGWLVLEPWITPSIFEGAGSSAVDEWTLCQALGDKAWSTLSDHWNSFITQGDFNAIKAAGLNHVRIPIGYWAVSPINGEPFVQGQLEALDNAVSWAQAAGIKILIDLHGAPGSQNGFDNSGRRGPINWQPGNSESDPALLSIKALAERYSDISEVVTAIEVINEPFIPGGLSRSGLEEYYNTAYAAIQEENADTLVVLSDGFQATNSWNGFMPGSPNIMMDTHHYEVFDNGLLAMNIDDHVKTVCSYSANDLQPTNRWVMVGEWTGALTDCAKYLNGRGIGARYDGTYPGSQRIGDCTNKSQGSVAGLSGTDRSNIRQFIEAQLNAWEKRNGWIFWTWKTEGAPEWDMGQLLGAGVFPQPLTDRQFPVPC